MIWGIVPAAGIGSRIQPLAFSKELLPVGSRIEQGKERPRAVSEYLVERMIRGGASRIAVTISPKKSDIIEYYGAGVPGATFAYVVQQEPAGLCDAIFQALPLLGRDDDVLIGLPDTIWYPVDAFRELPGGQLTFLCFRVAQPQHFDAVVSDDAGRVEEIQVKQADATSPWVWGALKLPVSTLIELAELWRRPERRDIYLGTLVTAWIANGGAAWAARAGTGYVDVGTMHGWRDAIHLLEDQTRPMP